MRNEIEVAEKFEDLNKRRLKERKENYLSKCYLNCTHNYRHRVKGHGMIGFCHNRKVIAEASMTVVVCDVEETAKNCKHFSCKNTNESVENDFTEVLSSPSRCGQEYPKLAILIWFLQGGTKNRESRLQRFRQSFASVLKTLRSIVTFHWW